MIVLILGPQGSGKGVQAKRLAKKMNFVYFSTGEYLRKLSDGNKDIADRLNSGVLFPDKEVFEYVTAFFETLNTSDNIVLDGYPRSVEQFKLLEDWLKERDSDIDMAILIEVSEETSIKRLSSRRQDPKTGKIYNLTTEPKPGPEVDISTLIQRGDDKPEAIKQRLSQYNDDTVPLLEVLKEKGILREVDGERTIEEIAVEISSLVEEGVKNEQN